MQLSDPMTFEATWRREAATAAAVAVAVAAAANATATSLHKLRAKILY